MKSIFLCVAATALVTQTLATQAYAGGRLEQIDLLPQQTYPGLQDANVVPIFWDKRCASISYTMDSTPANAGTPEEIPVQVLVQEQQTGFDQWNTIDTSFIEMNITETRTIGNGLRSFDFINELTWETPAGSGFLASSPSTSLSDEATFVPGDDIDGDGDSDVFDPVVEGRNTCYDADNDGDIEFPAGDYAAGTILDNDVQYNDGLRAEGVIWGVGPSNSAGQPFRETDVQAVAVHEFGHSHSLSHSMINQIDDNDGTGSTMFPFIDIDDAAAEQGQRDLHTDDVAWSSYVYPEGSSSSGIAALQTGDTPFATVYSIINGNITQADGLPVAGASIQAIDSTSGRVLSEGFSGFARLFVDYAGGFSLVSPEVNILDGAYEIPVPHGDYSLAIEAVDGSPTAAGSISLTAQVGDIYGQQSFSEEFWGIQASEDAFELYPGLSTPVSANMSSPVGIDFVVNTDVALNVGAAVDFVGAEFIGQQDNVIYASRFANADVLAILQSGAALTTGLFHTGHLDASFIPRFKEVSIVLGSVSSDGLTADIDFIQKFSSTSDFIGQDGDLTPDFYDAPLDLSDTLKQALQANPGKDVFLIAEVQDGLEGPTGLDPLIAIDDIVAADGEVATGNSFLSINGGAFEVQTIRDWIMELRFTDLSSET